MQVLGHITPSVAVGQAEQDIPLAAGQHREQLTAVFVVIGPVLRWLVGYSQQRREKTMAERLSNEIRDAANGIGAAAKRREDLHKMAESNKAFAHYRW